MKNLLTALLPAMALLALGGCASTAGLATSEDDGVYYSSKDRTTAVASAAPAPLSTDEAANPDYNGSPARSQANKGTGSDEYYDNTYTYMKGVPTSPGLNYYSPYSPYTTLSYAGGYGGFGGFSPYAYGGGFYDPFYSSFYSPFYSPFGYGYRSGISISLGFGYGRSFGYGYSPFGYGYSPYGGGFYDPFYSPYYYGGAFYGGYYGRGGYYGNSYYGGNSYGYGNNGGYSSYDNGGGRGRTSGHRNDRSSDGRVPSGGVSSSGGSSAPAPVPSGGGRVRSEMVAQPGGTMQAGDGVTIERGRGRVTDAGAATSNTTMEQATGGYNRPQRMDASSRPQYRNMDQPVGTNMQPAQPDLSPAQGQDMRNNGRGRWRNADVSAQPTLVQPDAAPQPQRQDNDRRRGGFFRNAPEQPANAGTQMTEQPQRRTYQQPQQRSFEQPQQQRTYEQPQQRSYEQPRQERSYSQPSQPSYSAPSGGGGGGGGGGHSRGRGE